jgi:pyridoxine 4-dehydrogenase
MPIPGLRRADQVEAAAAVLGWRLDPVERARLDDLARRSPVRMPANPFLSD